MIRILCLLVLGTIFTHAADTTDKFDLSITSVQITGSKMDFTIKIVNQSATPVYVDQKCAFIVLKGTGNQFQSQSVTTRPGVYKPRITILAPDGAPLMTPTNAQGRLFAPGVIAPGQSLTLSQALAWPPNYSLKNATAPLSAYVTLGYRTDTNATLSSFADKSTPPSPTYKLSENAQGGIDLTPAAPAP